MVVWVPIVTGHEILFLNDFLLLSFGRFFFFSDFFDPVCDPSELHCGFQPQFLLPPRSSSLLFRGPKLVNSLRSVARINGRRVARDAAIIPRPSSTQDQEAKPRMLPKKAVLVSASAGIYLKRTMDAIEPL
jgi:hypothetical protein